MLQAKVIQKWKSLHLICLLIISLIINVLLVILHIASTVEFINYGNEVLLDNGHISSDHYRPYSHTILSSIVIFIMFTTAVLFLALKRKINSFISTSISVNLIFILCYFFPTVLLAFIHDPLQIAYTCFMVIIFVFFIYALVWALGLVILARVVAKQTNHVTLFPVKTLIHFIILLTVAFSIYLFFAMIGSIVALGDFSEFKDLHSILLSLLVALLTVSILKPARNYAYRYATENTKLDDVDMEDDKERINVSSAVSDNNCSDQIFIKESEEDICKSKIDSQNNGNTTV